MDIPVMRLPAAALATMMFSGTALAAGSSQPNVLLIIADDLGIDKVGSYAADVDPAYVETARYLPETPVIDLLAESGVRFTDAWANPACSPTRASLFTGLLPMRHGVGQAIGRAGSVDLSVDETTLADILGDVGYAAGLFGKWHLGQGDNPESWSEGESWEDHLGETITGTFPTLELGWGKFEGTKGDLDAGTWTGYYDYMELVAVPRWGGRVEPNASSDYPTIATTQAALSWIDSQSGPWFATVAYHAPHKPLEVPPEGCGYDTSGESPTSLKAIYAAMVSCMDEQIGELLDGVDALQNTLVIFIGDNGTEDDLAEGVFDDGRGKGTLYETGVRVPFIVADGYDYLDTLGVSGLAPSGAWNNRVESPGRAVSDPVHVLDIFATVGDLASADTSTGVDATSLVPLLSDSGDFERDPVVSELHSSSMGTLALRSGSFKVIVSARGGAQGCRSGYEIFNINDDRLEASDLYRRQPKVAESLMEKLDELVATEPGSWLDVPDCS